MKKTILVTLMILALGALAAAQIRNPPSDVLGAHLNYGRGCAACHAPHSGAWGNGANKSGDVTSGNYALWGQDVGNLFGKQIINGQEFPSYGSTTSYTENLPGSMGTGAPDVSGLITCLSCHDGNWAQGAMMKNQVYEALPPSYGAGRIPTLLGNDGDGTGDYLNDHPVGLNAIVTCGGQWNWDCTDTNGTITMNGPNSYQFTRNYGWFVSLTAYQNNAVVTCTSCHNQHLMNVVSVTNGSQSGLPSGNYATMFFIRGPYNPGSGTAGSNQTAQFCRSCHGSEANESNGGGAIPTTF
jgi:hypothetical protein